MRKSQVRSRFASGGDGSLFISAKTETAIPARCALLRDALIQASLDPQVRSLRHVASAVVAAQAVSLDAVVVVRDDGRYVLDVVEARRVRDVEDEGLALIALGELGLTPLVLTAEEIRREPRFGNSRLVWANRQHPVGITMRMRILTVLADDGPMPLGRLLEEIRGDRDPTPAVMALACSDLVTLDLDSRPLGPATIARCRT
jgi:hypothetical protein